VLSGELVTTTPNATVLAGVSVLKSTFAVIEISVAGACDGVTGRGVCDANNNPGCAVFVAEGIITVGEIAVGGATWVVGLADATATMTAPPGGVTVASSAAPAV